MLAINEKNQKNSEKKLKKLKNLTERKGEKKPKKITELKGVGGKGGGLPQEIKGLPEKKNTKEYNQIDKGKSSGRPKKILDTTVETKPPAFLISSYIGSPEPKKRASIFQQSEEERFFWESNYGY